MSPKQVVSPAVFLNKVGKGNAVSYGAFLTPVPRNAFGPKTQTRYIWSLCNLLDGGVTMLLQFSQAIDSIAR